MAGVAAATAGTLSLRTASSASAVASSNAEFSKPRSNNGCASLKSRIVCQRSDDDANSPSVDIKPTILSVTSSSRNGSVQGKVGAAKAVRRAAAAAAGLSLGWTSYQLMPLADALVRGGGGGGFGGNGGWSGGGGGGWNGGFSGGHKFGPGAALAMGNDDGGGDGFLCEAVKTKNLFDGPGVPTQDELLEHLQCQPGKICTRADVNADLNTLLSTGLFQKVDVEVEPTGTGYVVIFTFREKVWAGMKSFTTSGSTILPKSICDAVLREAKKSKWTTVRVLAQAKTLIEEWYQERGLVFGTVSSFDGMETGKVTAQITEGEIAKVDLVFVDNAGNILPHGATRRHVVMRELPFKKAQLYNIEDGKKALRDIFALNLFDNVQVVPRADQDDPSKVAVDILLKERPMKTADIELEWPLQPNDKGRPTLVSWRPGGSIFLEHRNLQGEGRQLYGSISTSNFFHPNDDLGFKVEYVRPFLYGDKDPQRTAMRVSAFNTRRLSPVFVGGPGVEDVPPVWVDRMGAKVLLSQQYDRNSRLSYGVVMQEVTTRDESGQVCVRGSLPLPNGSMAPNGPPTTLSDTGTDRIVYLQGNLTRDNTDFVNGTPIGARDIFQVDQGLGIGSKSPFFNRFVVTFSRFFKLRKPPRKSFAPPPVIVLHTRAGNTIGDLASYDAFTLGGPHSVRGYNVGEIAICRRFAEVGAEIRVPVLGKHVFAFWEYGTDLGSSEEVRGNPTQFFKRAGSGACYGAGVKIGAARAEYAIDCNTGQGAFFMRFGERY